MPTRDKRRHGGTDECNDSQWTINDVFGKRTKLGLFSSDPPAWNSTGTSRYSECRRCFNLAASTLNTLPQEDHCSFQRSRLVQPTYTVILLDRICIAKNSSRGCLRAICSRYLSRLPCRFDLGFVPCHNGAPINLLRTGRKALERHETTCIRLDHCEPRGHQKNLRSQVSTLLPPTPLFR